MFAAEDRQQVIERGVHPAEVANVAPVDGIRVVAKVIVGQMLQPRQLGVDRDFPLARIERVAWREFSGQVE